MDQLDHPFYQVAADAKRLVEKGNATVWQKWSCDHCGARQTMDVANKFFTRGLCEECGGETDIEHKGCNYLLVMTTP